MKRHSAAALAAAMLLASGVAAFADEPLVLARDGFMYVGGKTMPVDGHDYFYGQMYVEIRIPAKQTHPYPIVMVHGGSMSGTNYTGTAGWPRRLGTVFRPPGLRRLCRRPAGPRTLRIPDRCDGADARIPPATTRHRASSRRKSPSSGRRPCCTRNGPATASQTTPRRCNSP